MRLLFEICIFLFVLQSIGVDRGDIPDLAKVSKMLKDVVRCKFGQSNDENLLYIEAHIM